MFNAPPLSELDIPKGRERTMSEDQSNVSPTFSRRDDSPSGSFDILDTDHVKPTLTASAPSPESVDAQEPPLSDKVLHTFCSS